MGNRVGWRDLLWTLICEHYTLCCEALPPPCLHRPRELKAMCDAYLCPLVPLPTSKYFQFGLFTPEVFGRILPPGTMIFVLRITYQQRRMTRSHCSDKIIEN